jgi:hypothetical protein
VSRTIWDRDGGQIVPREAEPNALSRLGDTDILSRKNTAEIHLAPLNQMRSHRVTVYVAS